MYMLSLSSQQRNYDDHGGSNCDLNLVLSDSAANIDVSKAIQDG